MGTTVKKVEFQKILGDDTGEAGRVHVNGWCSLCALRVPCSTDTKVTTWVRWFHQAVWVVKLELSVDHRQPTGFVQLRNTTRSLLTNPSYQQQKKKNRVHLISFPTSCNLNNVHVYISSILDFLDFPARKVRGVRRGPPEWIDLR